MRFYKSISDFFHHNYPSVEHLGMPVAQWRQRIYRTVFETNSVTGLRFERWLTCIIIASLCVVIAHSIPNLADKPHLLTALRALEWIFTLGFTVEYVLRLVSVRHPWRYVFSFYGVVDLLSVLPTYLGVFYPEAHFLAAVRALRLVRAFYIFPALHHFLDEYLALGRALRASVRKICVFLSVVGLIVLVMGTLIYVIEGPERGFTSVPTGIYWAISTVTTVGYGDVTPTTALGRIFASIVMLLGWGIVAVPTGIVGAELSRHRRERARWNAANCAVCGLEGHEGDARYCRRCSARLGEEGVAASAAPSSRQQASVESASGAQQASRSNDD